MDDFGTLLCAARTGAAWACTRIYEDLKGPVAAFCRLSGVPDPDDVTSEVFLHLFRDLGRFSGDRNALQAFVFTIARRRVADEWRRRARRAPESPWPDGFDLPDPGSTGDEILDPELLEVLGRLTDAQREVVLLRIVADLSIEQVAAATGRTVLGVKALHHRALCALRRELLAGPHPGAGRPAIGAVR